MNRQPRKVRGRIKKVADDSSLLQLPLMVKTVTVALDQAPPRRGQRGVTRPRAAAVVNGLEALFVRSSSAPEPVHLDPLFREYMSSGSLARALASADDAAASLPRRYFACHPRSSDASSAGHDSSHVRTPSLIAEEIIPGLGLENTAVSLLDAPSEAGRKTADIADFANSSNAAQTFPRKEPTAAEAFMPLISKGAEVVELEASLAMSPEVQQRLARGGSASTEDLAQAAGAALAQIGVLNGPRLKIIESQLSVASYGAQVHEGALLRKDNVGVGAPSGSVVGEALNSKIKSAEEAMALLTWSPKKLVRPSLVTIVRKIIAEVCADTPALSTLEQLDEPSDNDEEEEKEEGNAEEGNDEEGAKKGKPNVKISGLSGAVAATVAAERVKARKVELDAMDKTELCKDISGRRHVIKELRRQRHKAVMRGMDWLARFLKSDGHAALYAIGDDAPSVFFEIWYTSADSRIRCKARGIAETLIERYEASLLAGNQSPDDQGGEQFFECMFLLRCKHEMELDTSALLARADSLFKQEELRDTNKLFGVDVYELGGVPVADWLMLLMRVMCLEYNNLLHRKRWPLKWGLRECFTALRRVPLQPPPAESNANDAAIGEAFHHAFYLATHIVYAIGAYSVVKTSEKDVPWLYKYCRESLRFWMRRAKAKAQAGGHDTVAGKEIYVDIDGVAECADVLRGTGLTEGSDPLLCAASVWLMRQQKKSGAWPVWMSGDPGEVGFYDKLHPSWVATQCLRDRDFEIGFTRPGNALWASFMSKTLVQSNFTTLEYATNYKKGTAAMKA